MPKNGHNRDEYSAGPPSVAALPDDLHRPGVAHTPHPQRRPGLAPGNVNIDAAPFKPLPPPPLAELDPELVDPLRVLEEEIAALEREADAEAKRFTRAERWIALANLWEQRLHCPMESTRALREAVAAYPYLPKILQRTALACCALGDHALAQRYAKAATLVATHGPPLHEAHVTCAELSLRVLDWQGALEPLRAAAAAGGGTPILVQLAVLLAAAGHPDAPVALVRAAQALSSMPAQACGFWAEAAASATQMAILAQGLANSLAGAGYPRAAAAILADVGERTPSVEGRRALLLQAVRLTEKAQIPRLSTLLLLRCLELEPENEAVQRQLSDHLCRDDLRPAERAVIAQDIACLGAEPHRGRLLGLAGAAALQVQGEEKLGRLLLQHALWLGDDSQTTLSLLELAERPQGPPPAPVDLAADLERRAETAAATDEQALLQRRLAGLYHMAGDYQNTARAALRCLALEPDDEVAAVRLLRAAIWLGDTALLEQAMAYAVQTGPEGSYRAYHWIRKGRRALRHGQIQETLRCIEAALEHDADNPDTVLLILGVQEHLDASTVSGLLARSEGAFPDLSTLLCLRVELALSGGDPALAASLLERWIRCAPADPRPRQHKLELSLDTTDQADILADARALLPVACTQKHMDLIYRACDRAAIAGRMAGAAQTLLLALERCGSRDQVITERALEYARLSADNALVSQALERRVLAHEGVARQQSLWLLADHYARTHDKVAEMRTLIRLLAEAGYDVRAVERLALLFEQACDAERLMATLSLALRAESDPGKRRSIWLRIATAQHRFGGLADGAQRYVARLLAEQPADPRTVAEGIGLLLSLADDPRHGARQAFELTRVLPDETACHVALRLVRTAQVDLQDYALACSLCAEAVLAYPSCGELLLLIEELTLQSGDIETALDVYNTLLADAAGGNSRRALHYRAGRWLEEDGDLAKAAEHLAAALALRPTPGAILNALTRVAQRRGDKPALLSAYLQIARSGSGTVRRLYGHKAMDLARHVVPDEVPALAKEFGLDEGPGSEEPPSERPMNEAPLLQPAMADGEVNPADVEGESPSEVATLDDTYRMFLQTARAEPHRVTALRGLHKTAQQLDRRAAYLVSSQLISLFDRKIQGPSPWPDAGPSLEPRGFHNLLYGPLPIAARTLLDALWQRTRHLRVNLRTADSYDLTDADLVTAGNHPRLFDLNQEIVRTLELPSVPLYAKEDYGYGTTICATHPVAIIAHPSLAEDDLAAAHLAQTLTMAQPHYAIVTALAPEHGRTLLSALCSAFGPPNANADKVTLESRVLAATLWDSVPAQEHATIRETVCMHAPLFDHSKLHMYAVHAGLRAALLALADPRPVLSLLDKPVDIRNEEDFIRAIKENPAVADLFTTALSSPYFAALDARTIPAARRRHRSADKQTD